MRSPKNASCHRRTYAHQSGQDARSLNARQVPMWLDRRQISRSDRVPHGGGAAAASDSVESGFPSTPSHDGHPWSSETQTTSSLLNFQCRAQLFTFSTTTMPPRASADIFTATQEPVLDQQHLHGMLLTWDSNLLVAFVDAANSDEFPNLDHPPWLTEQWGKLTTQGFVRDTMAYLAQSAGGLPTHGTTLSPLTPMQSNHLSRTMGQIEMHPFIQACARKLPEGGCLVSGTLFFQDPVTDGVPTNLPSPPPPHRQIFI